MTPNESLQQRKADLNQEIAGFLLNLEEDESIFRQRIVRVHTAASHYREALVEAARHVSVEKSEAYLETASEATKSVSHFIRFLSEFRNEQHPPV